MTLLPDVSIKSAGITGMCIRKKKEEYDIGLFLSYFNGSLIYYEKSLQINSKTNSNNDLKKTNS